MTAIQTKAEIITALEQVRVEILYTTIHLMEDQFFQGMPENWSAADYLKHLILSVKPFTRAIELPLEQLEARFGIAQKPSTTFAQLVERYTRQLQAGLRAEGSPTVMPDSYRFPEDVDDDIQSYLAETWDEANARLIAALANWTEDNLDRYVLPHPALSNLTIREMCFFTIHHNRGHHKDMLRAAAT